MANELYSYITDFNEIALPPSSSEYLLIYNINTYRIRSIHFRFNTSTIQFRIVVDGITIIDIDLSTLKDWNSNGDSNLTSKLNISMSEDNVFSWNPNGSYVVRSGINVYARANSQSNLRKLKGYIIEGRQ